MNQRQIYSPSSMRRSIFSPSDTADWLFCPVFRSLRKIWTPREVEWAPNRLLGIAVQEGINWHLKGAADDVVENHVQDTLQEGFQPQAKYTLEGLHKLALRGVQALVDADLFVRHQILMLDEPLSQSRPDVVSRHETEGLGVSDIKVSLQVGERYRAQRLSEYTTDDQFWHYAWEVGESLGEPVKWVRPVVCVLTPKATVLTELVRIEPERLDFWLQGAYSHWSDMAEEEAGSRTPAPRWPSCRGGKFGPCQMYDACHVFHHDPAQMEVFYERRVPHTDGLQ